MQGYNAVAALFSQVRHGIVTADRVGRVIPGVLVAGNDCRVAVNCIIDGQVQGHN